MQPVSLVLQALSIFEEIYGNHINLVSTTNALGWSSLISGFGEEKVSYKEMLPIQRESDVVSVTTGLNKPTLRTIKIISLLLANKQVPRKVLLMLAGTGVLKYLDKGEL
ncbi:MAG: hypothetical protein HC773_00950 [Scytonema sp. CRU_2_7]|nr:hypothetical protein [Scytonema sp. CRU_2_7]